MKLVLTLMLTIVIVGGAQSILWHQRLEFNGKRVSNELSIHKCSKILCAVFCSSNEGCSSFFYNVNVGVCFLHGPPYAINTPSFPDSGCEYYTSSPTEALTTTSTLMSAIASTTFTTPTLILTTVSTTTTPKPIVCPTSSNYILANNICFQVVYSSKNWANSRLNCQKDGGDLIILDSQQKIDVIQPYISIDSEYLTGMFNVNGQDDFELIDGRNAQDFTFRAWANNEPNAAAGPSSCGRFKGLKWSVGKCTVSRQSLCEVK